MMPSDDTADLTGAGFVIAEGGTGDDRLTYIGSGFCDLYGGDGYDFLIGGQGGDRLEGGWGDDLLFGRGGTDTLYGGANNDNLHGESGYDALYGGQGNDNLWGDSENDRLYGGDGDDTLRGGSGIDRMAGDDGDDTYEVTEAGDRVLEHAGEGLDVVFADVSYTLPVNVEDLRLFGTRPINGTGNSIANQISGTSAANTIRGMAGNDFLDGLGGADKLVGGSGGDRLIGDLGADDFIYESVADSRGALRDTIVDFNRAQGDDIWLRAIDANTTRAGNQNFTFVGTKPFSGKAGELRYQRVGSDTHVSVDVNGDKRADMVIVSDKVIAFVAGDFIL